MSFDMDGLSEDEVTPNAETGPAELGGVPGLGTLQIVRGHEGEVLDVIGTWHLVAGEAGRDLHALEEAYEQGDPVVYEGKLDDPADPERREVKLEVRISSVGRYPMDAQQSKEQRDEESEPVPELRFFNFHPHGDWPEDDKQL